MPVSSTTACITSNISWCGLSNVVAQVSNTRCKKSGELDMGLSDAS